MTHQTDAAREAARTRTGQFGTQEHTSPEVALDRKPAPSPKALGMVGLGPASVNVLAEPADSEEDRPARPYFALTPGDDDEFFDAPSGSRVAVVEKIAGGTRVREYVRAGQTWNELGERTDAVVGEKQSGELWEDLFEEDGTMRSAMLSAPEGMLYSDKGWFVRRADIDKPLTHEDAMNRLAQAGRVQLLSRSTFGDRRSDGIPPALTGPLAVTVDDAGVISFQPVGGARGSARRFTGSATEVFDREGAIVFRRETDPGYGWEETFRVLS